MLKYFRKYKTGIAFSGGGARGIAHLGAMQAIYEANIKPSVFSGTSAGAIFSTLLADGKTPIEVLDIVKSIKRKDLVKPNWKGAGFMNTDGLRSLLEQHFQYKNLEDLPIPCYVAATNIKKGRIEYFNTGNIIEVVLASAGIPGLFQVQYINGKAYIDGGVMDNLPVAPIKNDSRKLIAIHVNPLNSGGKYKSTFQIAERAFQLAIASDIERKKKMVDLFIEPKGLRKYGILDVKKAEEIYELGYKEAKKILD